MARPLRIQAPGLTYHVTARGVRRSSIYLDDEDRERFLTLLARVVDRYALQCHAYCQMTTHYHVALTTTDANLSRAIRQLNGEYAQWWNWRHDRNGHVFQARFYAQIVQDESYLLNVCRYIVLNPVRAGMVRRPEHWRWSSYRAMLGLAARPPFLDCRRLLEVLAPNDPSAGATHLRECILTSEDEPQQPLPSAAILGDDEFVTRLAGFRSRASREVPRREGRPTLDAIFRDAITRTARDRAILAAYRERFALAEIARYVELHPSTVSRIVAAGVRS
jgi:REP element-mobilizing transposase RayT